MATLNAFLRGFFDAVLGPLSGLSPWVGISILSLVVGVIALVVFKYTSDQEGLERVKDQIWAGLFEIRLFNDDLGAITRAQADILRHNLRYIRLSMLPFLVLLVPMFFIFAQMQFHYGYTGLDEGEAVLLRTELKPDWKDSAELADASGRPAASLTAPEGVTVDLGPHWSPDRDELLWRIHGDTPGVYDLALNLGGETYTKSVVVGDELARRSPVRTDTDFLDQLLYPAEAPLPSEAPVEAIHLEYPDADLWFFGLDVPWWVVFLFLSLVFAFALRGPLGVTF